MCSNSPGRQWTWDRGTHCVIVLAVVQSLSCVPSPSPGACSNLGPSHRWCHPTISSSIFSSHLQSFPASGSFPMSRLFASGGRSIGASASPSVLPVNVQGWFHCVDFTPGFFTAHRVGGGMWVAEGAPTLCQWVLGHQNSGSQRNNGSPASVFTPHIPVSPSVSRNPWFESSPG